MYVETSGVLQSARNPRFVFFASNLPSLWTQGDLRANPNVKILPKNGDPMHRFPNSWQIWLVAVDVPSFACVYLHANHTIVFLVLPSLSDPTGTHAPTLPIALIRPKRVIFGVLELQK